jgi:hypothetical protein
MEQSHRIRDGWISCEIQRWNKGYGKTKNYHPPKELSLAEEDAKERETNIPRDY